MGVLTSTNCVLREEVLRGDLDDAIFAADFGDLVANRAPPVYGDAKTFFQHTHPAAQLSKVVQAAFGRLTNANEGGATIRLSTGFGGGKTHTLMALWHLAQNISDPAMGTELLPAAGRPQKLTVVAVDAGKAGVPLFAEHRSLKVHSLWGEIFLRLGGERALKTLGEADHPEASPNEQQLEAIFPKDPVLILLDELVIYMAKLSERGQGNLLGFLNSLASVVSKRPQTVLMVTDPAGQVAYAGQAARIGDALVAAATKLDEIFGRKMTDFDPIGNEGARVIVRRLFERVNPAAAQAASAIYHHLYERVLQEVPGSLPPDAGSADYAKRIVECYPFHPRLLDTAQDRLGALQDFQKSRGVLRLFARILRDVWEAGEDYELITAGEINWSSPRIQADLLQRLNRDNFKAVISADIEKHAGELDVPALRGIHRRVASALLLESLPLQPSSGLDPVELTLAVLRPDEAGPEPAEALDRLVGVCWHTYPMLGGRGWQFRYEPNLIKQIEERMTQIPLDDAKSRVLAEAQGYFSGPAFKLTPWPKGARQVPETAELQLVLCDDERLARSVCAYSDDTDPKAPIPRGFQNAILAVTATTSSFNNAVDRAQRLLAAEAIEREHRAGESSRLVREQLQRIKPDLQKQFRIQTCRAFDRVVLAGGLTSTLEEQFQVSDEQILQRAHGQTCLRKFLDVKGLVYQAGDALDIERFLKDVLPGTTPLPEKPEVYTAKAIHERFLSAPGQRLVPDGGVVRQTLLRAVADGKIVIRLADGRTYDARGGVEGSDGQRRRMAGALTTVPLDDAVLIARANSDEGTQWVKEDTPAYEAGGPGSGTPPPPPPAPARVTATTWEKVLELAVQRPLVELHLIASTPAAAGVLLSLAQPLGAETITLSVMVSGTLKDSGSMNFAANDVKPSHPTRPLTIAQTIFNALESGASYEADLTLGFGTTGRTELEGQLRALTENAPEGISPRTLFERPIGGER
jgi:Protein of unknown function (DUF499)